MGVAAQLLKSLVFVAIGFGAAEAYARFSLGLAPGTVTDDTQALREGLARFVEADHELGFRYRPNVDQLLRAPDGGFEILFKTNEIGLRDRPMGTHLRSELKFLVFGDEFAEGWGTDIDETAVVNAQRALNAKTALAPPVRLVIAGKSGYGAAQNLGMARRLVTELEPRAMIFLYSSLMPHVDRLVTDGGPGAAPPPHSLDYPQYGNSPLAPIAAYSALARWLTEYLVTREMAAGNPPGVATGDRLAGIRGEAAGLADTHGPSLEAVKSIAALARERGIPFMLVHLPLPPQVAADAWPKGRAHFGVGEGLHEAADRAVVKAFCEAESLRCHALHDLLADTAAASDSLPLYHPAGFALTVAGSRVVGDWLAATLYDWMEETGLR
jgi:hypothetical protein